jgi:SAM-dependent methyltransferase
MDQSGGYIENRFVVDFYDQVVAAKERGDIPFYLELATSVGGSVLDLACGTGRILIQIARAGISVTGLDISQWMLSVCRQRLSLEKEVVRRTLNGLVRGDMTEFSFEKAFDLIIIPFYSFNYLTTVEEQKACLACAYRNLRKGGTLVLDLPNPNLSYLVDNQYLSEFGDEPDIEMPDGRRLRRRHVIRSRDLSNQVLVGDTNYYVDYPDGRHECKVNSVAVRYLFRYEAEHLLARSGFDIRAVYGAFDKRPFSSAGREMIVIGVRES